MSGLLLPVHLTSSLTTLAGASFKLKGLTHGKDLRSVLVVVLVEAVALLSILYVALRTGEEKGHLAAMLSGGSSLLLLHILPKLLLPGTVAEACRDCEPLGKFCVGVTALVVAVLAERVLRYVFTYR